MLQEWTSEDAARLIATALNPKASPITNNDYASLLRLMNDEPEFRRHVNEIATGLGLRIYYADDYGCVLGVTDKESRFALKLGNLRESFANEDTAALVIVMTVVIVAFFPTAEALEDEEYGQGEFITLHQLVNLLNQYLFEASKHAEDEEPNAMLAKGWRYLNELPAKKPNEQRSSKKSREGLLRHVLNFFSEHGFVTITEEDEQLRVFFTKRLRVQARDLLGNHLFIYLLELREKPQDIKTDSETQNKEEHKHA